MEDLDVNGIIQKSIFKIQGTNRIHLALDKDQERILVAMIMMILFPQNGKFLTK